MGQKGLGLTSLPQSAPRNLVRLLGDLALRLRAGRLDEARSNLRDGLGFCVRFFASTGAAAVQAMGRMTPELEELWHSGLTVADGQVLLARCVKQLEGCHDKLARSYREVFMTSFVARSKPRHFARFLGFGDQGVGETIADFCSQDPVPPEQDETGENAAAIKRYLSVLKEWMAAAGWFFAECEYRHESGHQFGQQELVVVFRQYTLKTRLPVRLREARRAADPSALGSSPLAAPLTPEEMGPSNELSELISAMLETQESLPPPKPVKEPEAKPPQLAVTADYRGYAKNEEGELGHAGTLTITNAGGGELRGSILSTNPLVQVTPNLFEGNTSQIRYWISPDAMPQPEGFIELRTATEFRRVPLTNFIPASRLSSLSTLQLASLLLLPGLLTLAYLGWVFRLTIGTVERLLRESLRDDFPALLKGAAVTFDRSGVGVIDLEVIPRVDSVLLMFLALAVLCPLLVAKLFRYYPRFQQRDLGFLFILGMVLPAIGFLALWNTPLLFHPMMLHPELADLNFRHGLPAFLGLNLGASLYLFLSVLGAVDRKVRNPMLRLLLPLVLVALAAALIVFMVYWT